MDFQVAKDDVHRCRSVDTAPPEFEPGRVLLEAAAFGLASDNITYAMFGEATSCRSFFLKRGSGRVPVWGFAEVTASEHDALQVGTPVFGYLPPSTDLVVAPTRVDAHGFVDAPPHGLALPPAYNRYLRVEADPAYDAGCEDQQRLLGPLFSRPTSSTTSWTVVGVGRGDLALLSLLGSDSPRDLPRLVGLKDLLALLAGANADGFLDWDDEDLPVADPTRAGVREDHLFHDLEVVGLHDDLHLELGPQVDGQLRAAVVLGDAPLAPGPLVLGDRHRRKAPLEQLRADGLEGLMADEGLDLLHLITRLSTRTRLRRRRGAGPATGAGLAISATGMYSYGVAIHPRLRAVQPPEEVMEILEAFDLTATLRGAAELAGCDHKTVAHWLRAREGAGGGLPVAVRRRPRVDAFALKLEEWVDRSRRRIRADVAHQRLVATGYRGSERTTRRAVATATRAWRAKHGRRTRPSVTEPGLWMQWDYGDGPEGGRPGDGVVLRLAGVEPLPRDRSAVGSDNAVGGDGARSGVAALRRRADLRVDRQRAVTEVADDAGS